MSILQQIYSLERPSLAVLIDPDHIERQGIESLLKHINSAKVDFLFVGGSHISIGNIDKTVNRLKEGTHLPVILFPGSVLQIADQADAMLFLSLISGRNPEYLIGQHVVAAPYLRKIAMETIPTGYMLIDGGKSTTASYMSNTSPLPMDKPMLAASTAMAGEMLGMKMIYADAGSGARYNISPDMIRAIKTHIHIPLIVGGGICEKSVAEEVIHAGADIVVIGNEIERRPDFIKEINEIL